MEIDTSPSSPHFGGIQPSWRELNFTTELLHNIWATIMEFDNLYIELEKNVGKSKLDDSIRFLRKCGLLAEDNGLTLTGILLTDEFRPAATSVQNDGIVLGEKRRLSDGEVAILRNIIFRKNTVPMMAAIHQLAFSEVSDKETEQRAKDFVSLTGYLDEYDSSWSIGTKKKKAQAHFEWVKQLDLAERTRDDHIELTPTGRVIHKKLKNSYPANWPKKVTDY